MSFRNFTFLIIALIGVQPVIAQSTGSTVFSVAAVKENLNFLASDTMKGRALHSRSWIKQRILLQPPLREVACNL